MQKKKEQATLPKEREAIERVENIWRKIQLKGDPRQAINTAVQVQQVKYPAQTLRNLWSETQ